MSRVEPTLENAFARDSYLREGSIHSAEEDWRRRPTRRNRNWARLLARAAASDSDASVRNAAIEALSHLGTIADRRVLTAALGDEWEVVRASAVSGLALVVGRRAERDVLRATEDRSTIVRRWAWFALYDALGADARESLEQAAERERDDEVVVSIWSALLFLGHHEARARLAAYAATENPRLNGVVRESLEEFDAESVHPVKRKA